MAIVTSIAIPQTMATAQRSQTWAATRYLWAQMALARAQAIKRSATVALRFDVASSGITFAVYVDGNRNGVLTRDIKTGVDKPLEAPANLSELFPAVAIAFSTDTGPSDPLRFGTSNLFSFTPIGTSSSGSVYVRGRDGSQYAVRILGATARARVLRYVPATGDWIESY